MDNPSKRIASSGQHTTYVFMEKYGKLSLYYHQIPSSSVSLTVCQWHLTICPWIIKCMTWYLGHGSLILTIYDIDVFNILVTDEVWEWNILLKMMLWCFLSVFLHIHEGSFSLELSHVAQKSSSFRSFLEFTCNFKIEPHHEKTWHAICEQRRRSACAFVQSDHLCCLLPG